MNLGTVLRKWRLMSELDLRAAAEELGVDHATLYRLEQGRMPSAETLIAVWKWLLTRPTEE